MSGIMVNESVQQSETARLFKDAKDTLMDLKDWLCGERSTFRDVINGKVKQEISDGFDSAYALLKHAEEDRTSPTAAKEDVSEAEDIWRESIVSVVEKAIGNDARRENDLVELLAPMQEMLNELKESTASNARDSS